MTGKQYNGMVRWALGSLTPEDAADSARAARRVFRTVGVAFPRGNCAEALTTLLSEQYMGWESCTRKDAQQFANDGIPAVGVSANSVMIVTAEGKAMGMDNEIMDGETADNETVIMPTGFSVQTAALEPAELVGVQFFAATSAGTTTNKLVQGIQLPATLSFGTNASASVSAAVTPTEATDSNLDWFSDSPAVLIYEPEWGAKNFNVIPTKTVAIKTGSTPGTATLTATSRDGSHISASCLINVGGAVLATSIAMNPSSMNITLGTSQLLTATVNPGNVTNPTVSSSSSNTAVATVDLDGLARQGTSTPVRIIAKSVGTCAITAAAIDGSGKSSTCNVTVSLPPDSLNHTDEATQRLYIWKYLRNIYGLSEKLTAAVMGNMFVESVYSPTKAENHSTGVRDNPDYIPLFNVNDGIGWGLCQWTNDRKKDFLKYFTDRGAYLGDMVTQLEFLYHECTGSVYGPPYQAFLGYDATQFSLRDAVQYFCVHIEGISGDIDARETGASNALTDLTGIR